MKQTIVKADIARAIAEKIGAPINEIDALISAAFNEIHNQVVDGNEVTIRGIGTFYPHKRREVIDNLHKGKTHPSVMDVKVKISKTWTQEVGIRLDPKDF